MLDLTIHSAHQYNPSIQIINASRHQLYTKTTLLHCSENVNPMARSFGQYISQNDGYDSRFYSHSYSLAIATDIYAVLAKNKLSLEIFDRYREIILSKGGSVDSMKLIKKFLGHDPNPAALVINLFS